MRVFRDEWSSFRHEIGNELIRFARGNAIGADEYDAALNVMEKYLNTHFIIDHPSAQ